MDMLLLAHLRSVFGWRGPGSLECGDSPPPESDEPTQWIMSLSDVGRGRCLSASNTRTSSYPIRVKAAGILAVVLLLALAIWIGTAGDRPAGSAPPRRAMSDRVLASRGFLPPGAPLQPPPAPEPRDGAVSVGFGHLAGFDYAPESGSVPEAIRRLDGKTVEVLGVMYFSVPDPARVTEFFLMPDHTVCCFGTPRLNQIIEVVLPEGDATEYVLDYYLVRGRLQIGPFYDDAGFALCLYRIEDAVVEFMN